MNIVFDELNCKFFMFSPLFFYLSPVSVVRSVVVQRLMKRPCSIQHIFFFLLFIALAFVFHCHCLCQLFTFHNLWYEKFVTDFYFYALLSVIIVVLWSPFGFNLIRHVCVAFYFIVEFYFYFADFAPNTTFPCAFLRMKWNERWKKLKWNAEKNWQEPGNI